MRAKASTNLQWCQVGSEAIGTVGGKAFLSVPARVMKVDLNLSSRRGGTATGIVHPEYPELL